VFLSRDKKSPQVSRLVIGESWERS